MKSLDDRGHALALSKPLVLRRYEPSRLPDPGQCTDAIIIINDRSDGVPRGRLAVSNGASWDTLLFTDEQQARAIPSTPATAPFAPADLGPLVRTTIAAVLPALLPRPVPPTAAPTRARFTFNGRRFDVEHGRVALAVASAGAAVAGGVQAGDLRWHGGEIDFTWSADDGTAVPMDAPTVLAFGLVCLKS